METTQESLWRLGLDSASTLIRLSSLAFCGISSRFVSLANTALNRPAGSRSLAAARYHDREPDGTATKDEIMIVPGCLWQPSR